MSKFKIQKQTEAEKDDFLMECFYDAGFIEQLKSLKLGIVSGRKGAGKTALARYVEKNSNLYGIELAHRISVRNISISSADDSHGRLNSILFFIIIQTIQKLLEAGMFEDNNECHWKDFLLQNGLQQISDYEAFAEMKREQKTGFSINSLLSMVGLCKVGSGVQVQETSQLSRTNISNTPSSLINSLKQSLSVNKKIFIFVDDVSDYLDAADEQILKKEISLIKDLLLTLDTYNSIFADAGLDLRFISLIREDLLDFMDGSNVNKLRSDSLHLEWDEKSFAGILVRRLPFFQTELARYMEDPVAAIQSYFPDDIFFDILSTSKTNRYRTNFYAYMVAISFNRPRDFLVFCYAMRNRLSPTLPVVFENIEASETEYSDYFSNELRDEMYLSSRILNYEFTKEKLERLVDVLSKKDGINSSELRTELSQYLGEKTSLGKKKIEAFIEQLWLYGLLGYKEKSDKIIRFRYVSGDAPLLIQKIKEYTFFLHRGLYWFIQRRKNKK